MPGKLIISACLILFSFTAWPQGNNEELPAKNFKFNPSVEIGIAQRSHPFELSPDIRYQGYSRFTYEYDRNKHFRNFSVSLALHHFVLKKRISAQLASYFRYNHLYYGKNAQGVSSNKEKEYKRLKYDVFIDGLYHFKKRKTNSIGIVIGLGIGYMNFGTRFKDSTLNSNNQYRAAIGGFDFFAPRLIVGLNKNKFSFFAIAHGTPDSDYRSNPSIWLEFKGAYSFSLSKNKESKSVNASSEKKFKLNPSIEVGIAYRPGVIELSELSKYPNPSPIGYTYAYNSKKHFNNVSLSIAVQQLVLKNRISLQAVSYFRYGHLYYGKNPQGVSSNKEKEYKRLKYDFFIDGLYHFKKTNSGVGIVLGAGIGLMNNGTKFKDSAWRGNDYVEAVRAFRILAPRIIIGASKNKFSFFTIAHGTPDAEYEGNPSIWLEFKAAYSFSPFKKKKIN